MRKVDACHTNASQVDIYVLGQLRYSYPELGLKWILGNELNRPGMRSFFWLAFLEKKLKLDIFDKFINSIWMKLVLCAQTETS